MYCKVLDWSIAHIFCWLNWVLAFTNFKAVLKLSLACFFRFAIATALGGDSLLRNLFSANLEEFSRYLEIFLLPCLEEFVKNPVTN